MQISWNASLILMFLLVAMMGPFSACIHGLRMRESEGTAATVWMVAGGCTLGVAIWAMHFIGLLAFHLPIEVSFDKKLTFASLMPVIAAALFVYWLLRDKATDYWRIALCTVAMGAGITLMHYVSIIALRMLQGIEYEPVMFALAVAIATCGSAAALMVFHLGERLRIPAMLRLVLCVLILVSALSGMHFAALRGADIQPDSLTLIRSSGMETYNLALNISLASMLLFGVGIIAAMSDQNRAKRNAEALVMLERKYLQLLSDSELQSLEMTRTLRESEERLRMTLKFAPDAVFICERDGRIVYANENVVESLSYSLHELYRMTIFDLVPEDWRDTYRINMATILADHDHHVFEIRLISKEGRKIPMELNAVVLPNDRVYGSCRDITERKAVQRALQESEDNLQRLLNSVAEGIYGVDTGGICTFVNAAFLHILGYSHPDEVVGKFIHDLIHHTRADGSPYPAEECHMYQAFQSGQSLHVDDEVFWRKDGKSVMVEYWAHPIVKDGAVAGAVATFLDISARRQAEQKIHQLAYFDDLTGLPNRRMLLDRLPKALKHSERNERYGALMFLDLDNFKTLNDTKGHEIGDLLLVEVANRLLRCVREGDSIARLGGDEFVVVLEMLSGKVDEAVVQAELVGEKISATLNRPYQLDKYTHHATSSIGIVLFKGQQESIDNLIKYADTAMYQAKAVGRNAIRFYDPEMQAAMESRSELETELHSALEKQQFRLYYQIQVDSRRRPIGAEVLVRWEHPERGLVSPMQFIPLAEETGLIVPIGLWVLKTACSQLKKWQDNILTRDLVLAVNVSARQFRQPDFVEQVQRAIQESGAKPSHLKLELTESIVLKNTEASIEKMREIKMLGVSFSMDDFGTGYSSLQYLKRLPLDQIKIDQSFVRDITTDPNDAAIVQTVIAMTEAMGLNVIAEGVESENQMEFLDLRGCHAFQGYLFSKPIPIEQFESLLDQSETVEVL